MLLFGYSVGPDMLRPTGPDGVKECSVIILHSFYTLVWLPALVFEIILCLLMLYKAWKLHQSQGRIALLDALIRDSIIYFLSIFAVLLINCLFWILSPQNFFEVAVSWALAVPCAMGSRLLLNIRERYFRDEAAVSTSGSLRAELDRRRSAGGTLGLPFHSSSLTTGGLSFFSTMIDESRGSIEFLPR